MKPRLRTLIRARKIELRQANPKSRDRIRHKVKVLQVVERIKRECRP
jgi:hypothetical protein